MITNPLFDEYMPHLLEMIYNYYILGKENRYIKKLLQRMEARKHTKLVINKNKAYLRLTGRLDLLYGLTLILSSITFENFFDFNENNKQEMIMNIKDVLNGIITV